ncbi:hypothetical protein F0185_19870 [Massilia sp. CCM 8692]|uniref:DUF3558 domain-containing protein n=2 Tax=Massilia rubra TaxID=2607910 RepID=A0ABX0LVC4_9BURK|nr:hypothetical protein [Massilia rubra]
MRAGPGRLSIRWTPAPRDLTLAVVTHAFPARAITSPRKSIMPMSFFAQMRLCTGIAALFLVAPSHAATECPLLSTAEVAAAFADPGARVESADPSGTCVWKLSDDTTLISSFYKHPGPAETKEAFDAWKVGYTADFPRAGRTPPIGKGAYFGMRPASQHLSEAALLTTQGNSILILSYIRNSEQTAPDKLAVPILALGKQAIARSGKAEQSFGQCEWFSEAEARGFLGKGALKIHRSGPNWCAASVEGSRASLVVQVSDHVIDEKLGRDAPGSDMCKVVLMPQFGARGVAEYACVKPMNQMMKIAFNVNDKQVEISVQPLGRDANEADLKPLTAIAQRAYERF